MGKWAESAFGRESFGRTRKRFSINDHLASIIEDSTDSLNVYRSS